MINLISVFFIYIFTIYVIKFRNQNISDLLNYLDSLFIFKTDKFINIKINLFFYFRFILYGTFFLLFLRITIDQVKKNSIFSALLIVSTFILWDMSIVSFFSALFSFINSNSLEIYDLSQLSAFSSIIPDLDYIFYFSESGKSNQLIFNYDVNVYYMVSTILRVFLLFFFFRKFPIKRLFRNIRLKKDIVLYFNIILTFIFLCVLINIDVIYARKIFDLKNYTFIFICLYMPVLVYFEEYIFRFLLFTCIKNNSKRIYAMILSSLLFAATHFNFYSIVDYLKIFILSCIITVIYEKYGLISSFLAHLSYNLFLLFVITI